MNIYQKLQKCKVELQGMEIKKSGKNTYSGYDYFELSDIMPVINQLFDKHLLCGNITFADIATLTITNIEKPEEQILITSPMSDAQLKGCHPVQNLGAVQTYIRRYLYVNALDVTDADVLDATHGKEETSNPKQTYTPPPQQQVQQQTTNTISEAQAKRLFAGAKGNQELVREIMKNYDYTSTKDIKKADYDAIYSDIELAVKVGGRE